ncbi:MAG TPA: hypothetical protein VMV74_02330 [Bacteroidales bacterium]|nr:hypothetical protein [Bacteroidales bacterium]
MMYRVFLIILLGLTFFSNAGAQWISRTVDSIRKVTEADHREMMDQLNITSLRPGVNGMDPKASNAANYNETKANPYPKLPDLLVMNNGKKVSTSRAWWEKCRPDLTGLSSWNLQHAILNTD